MGLGSTAKKLQTVADRAEQLYKQLKDVRARVINLEESAEETHERVAGLERDLAEQRALLEALAKAEGIDTDRVLAEAAIVDVDAESTVGDETATETGDGADDGAAESGTSQKS